MLLAEILTEESLQEGMMNRAIAAAAVVVASLLPTSSNHNVDGATTTKVAPQASPTSVIDKAAQRAGADTRMTADQMIAIAAKRYKVDPTVVKQVVRAAIKYQDPVFPKAEHILAVIGVESSFNPAAVSKLRTDPAVGLMQQRPVATGVSAAKLTTIDGQIENGVALLKQYYKRVGGDADAALHAYNVGIGNHRKSLTNPAKGNPRYAPKVNKELALYKSQVSDGK